MQFLTGGGGGQTAHVKVIKVIQASGGGGHSGKKCSINYICVSRRLGFSYQISYFYQPNHDNQSKNTVHICTSGFVKHKIFRL